MVNELILQKLQNLELAVENNQKLLFAIMQVIMKQYDTPEAKSVIQEISKLLEAKK